MYRTFNGWKREGRQVAFGESGKFRNEYGDFMFHFNQTVPSASKVRFDSVGRPYVRKYI